MSALLRRLSHTAALFAACVGIAGMHAPAVAANDLPIVVQTCPKEGRDPSTLNVLTHSCGVSRPDDLAASPSWNVLEMMAVDGSLSGGGVVATLHCMSRASGTVSAVARVKSEPSGTSPKKVASRLPVPLDFTRCAYFVRIDVDGPTSSTQALMVSLRN